MAGPNESKKSQMSEVLSKLIETLSAQCLEAAGSA